MAELSRCSQNIAREHGDLTRRPPSRLATHPHGFTATFLLRVGVWIITMTLEEIRGQDSAMENADR